MRAGGHDFDIVAAAFANLLVSGRAPEALAPWLAGAAGHAFRKRDKSAVPGAPVAAAPPAAPLGVRPICCGEAWRRATCKAALAAEAGTTLEFLQLWQLAVGVPGGVD